MSIPADEDFIGVADHGSCRRVTLDRPGKINALTVGMMHGLARALNGAQQAGAKIVVLAGNGPKGFCAGADIDELATPGGPSQNAALLALTTAFATCELPVIVLLHGLCLGAGVILAALATVVLAAGNAVIGFPEMRFGLFPAIVHAALLERVAAPLALQLCLTGRTLDAVEAQRIGLIGEVLPADGFSDHASQRCQFYAGRLPALICAHRAARVPAGASVVERVRHAVPLIEANIAGIDPAALIAAVPRGRGAA